MMKANRDVRTNSDGLARPFYARWSRDTDISETILDSPVARRFRRFHGTAELLHIVDVENDRG
jgi:hypothetical protein